MASKLNKRRRRKRLERRFIDLTWFLIECKIMYYGCDYSFSSKFEKRFGDMPDDIYDYHERAYVRLSKLLRKENTVQSMVGVDLKRPSVQLAVNRLAKIDKEIRTKRFTGCKIRSRLGISKGAFNEEV